MPDKTYYIYNPTIKNVTKNSFEIHLGGVKPNSENPTSYDIAIYSDTEGSGEKSFKKDNINPKDFPYKFKSNCTGQKYTVFLTSHYSGTKETGIGAVNAETIFVPIERISVKNGVNKIKIYIPDEENSAFPEFSDKNIEIFPSDASNSNFHDNGTRDIYDREIQDSSVAEVDALGYVRGKSRGITKLRTYKHSSKDKFSDLFTEVEVIQRVVGLKAENDYVKILKGNQTNLNVYVLPENANNASLNFESESPSVASVSKNSGLVFANTVGISKITATSVDNPSKKVYIIVEVVDSSTPIWYETDEVGRYLNSGNFNMLQNNLEYVYNLVKNKVPSIVKMNFPRVTNTEGFLETRLVIDGFFENVYTLSNQSISGFEPIRNIKAEYNAMELAPDNKMWNDALTSIKQMKGVLENGK